MKRGYVIGIELNDEICQVSYYDEKIQQPQTIDANTTNSQIPFVIGKYAGHWIYGKEADQLKDSEKAVCVVNPVKYAINNELVKIEDQIYDGVELMSLFFQCILKDLKKIDTIVFSIPLMNKEIVNVLKMAGEKLGVQKERIYIQDYKESFGHYIICQPRELWQYDSVLFYCTANEMKAFIFRKIQERNGRGRDTFVVVDEVPGMRIEELESVLPVLNTEKAKQADYKFQEMIRNIFSGRYVSSVFLAGEKFKVNWYPESLKMLVAGKRVFQGNTLYSEGACYTAFLRRQENCNYPIYWDDSKMKEKISMKFRVGGMEEWYPIVSWGTRWYEEDKQFEVLLENSDDIEIRIESLERREVETIKVCLDGLPKRNNYTLRLKADLEFYDEKTCLITWKDVGFGAFYEPSGFQTETWIHLGGNNGEFNSMSQ